MSETTDRNDRTDSETVLAGSQLDTRHDHEACLVIIRGARLGSRIVLGEKPVTIGRSIDADFQISEKSISREHCRIFRDNGRFWVEDLKSTNRTFLNEDVLARSPLRDGDLIRVSQTVFKFVDESNIEAGYHSELHESTIRDALTGLYNRRHAMAVLKTEAAKSRRDASRLLAMVIIDVDYFKEINDEHGHLAGDGVLKRMSAIAGERVRGSDTFARIGGEEFALILPDTSQEEAVQLADDIRRAVEDTSFDIEGEEKRITVSGGVASWSSEMKVISDLLKLADERLYQAKTSGRNRIC